MLSMVDGRTSGCCGSYSCWGVPESDLRRSTAHGGAPADAERPARLALPARRSHRGSGARAPAEPWRHPTRGGRRRNVRCPARSQSTTVAASQEAATTTVVAVLGCSGTGRGRARKEGCEADVEGGRPGRPIVLTGGIGSGKSSVGRLLAGWGAFLVDADQLARKVVAPGTQGRAEVEALLGPDVVAPDGSLDRGAVAERVFADTAQLAAVEAIVHPLVHVAGVAAFERAPAESVLVYEVPLPGRSPFASDPLVVVVDAPDEVRRQRLADRGLSDSQISARMSQQPTRAEWLDMADHVVDNSGTTSDLSEIVAGLWREITGQSPPVGAES